MKKALLILIVLLITCSSVLLAQDYFVKGKIIDAASKKPLAFVNMVVNESRYGGTTDIDGKFKIFSNEPIDQLKISYVGYEDTIIRVENRDSLIIKLRQVPYELPEIAVLPGVNPAHRIISNVTRNKDLNDPEKLDSFSYTAYDKMYFTIDRDTLSVLDSIIADTSMQKIRKFIDEQHFFLMETVTERKFMKPERNHEKVIASRISGFKDPIIVFMISQMQSTSFYDDIIDIMGKTYVNPISKGSLNKYFFLLQDTAYTAQNDTVFIISYRPRKGTNFDGMKGVLSINSNGWAIQNVIAQPAKTEGMFEIRVQQLYEQFDGQWFPVQLNTDLKLRFVQVGTAEANMHMIGVGKSYLKDIELNPKLVARQFSNIEVEVDPDAYRMKENFWNQYRIDSLTKQEKRTYAYIDSIGEEFHFDEIAGTVDALMTGEIPWGHINLDMDKFIRYNNYEGLYLGLGAHTNQRFSQNLKIGGFWGYGFKDKTAKYGGNASLRLWRKHDLKLGVNYYWDAIESGGVRFFDDSDNLLRPENFRELLIRRMNMTENASAYLQFKTLKYLTVNLSLARQYKEAYGNYEYIDLSDSPGVLRNNFVFTELGIGLRYAYNETFLQTAKSKVSLGTDYPIIWLNYKRGLKDVFDGQFEYDRFDLKVEESFYSKYLGKTTLRLMGGYIDGKLPYCNLFNGNGSYRNFTLNAPFSFATMRMNEFLSNKYMAFYFYHDFDNLLLGGKRWKPELAIATNIAFGSLDHPDEHLNVDFNTMEKGYYESGILVNKLLNLQLYSLGFGAFYRYGPYSFDNAWDNVALRLSVKFPF